MPISVSDVFQFLRGIPGAALNLIGRSRGWAKEDRDEIEARFKAEIASFKEDLTDADDDEERAAIKLEMRRVRQEQRNFYRASRELLLSKSLVERMTPPGVIAAGEPQLPEADRELLETAASVVARLEPPKTFDDHLLQGNAFYTAGDFQKALEECNRALELRPDDPSTLNNRGAALNGLERYDDALADYKRALELRPDHPDILYNRGITLAKLQRYDDALADYNRALELRPDHPGTLYNRGLTLGNLQRYNDALTDYNRALELRPDHPDTLNNRGITFGSLKRYDDALADLNHALELRPDDPVALTNRGGALNGLERYNDALADLNHALELRPDHPDALNNRGITLGNLQRHNDALADFNRALELRPGHPDALYNRACLYSFTGRLRESLNDLKEAISRDQENRKMAHEDEDHAFDNLRSDPALGPEFERLVAEPDA